MGSYASKISSAHSASSDPFFAEHGYTQAPTLVQWMATLRCELSCPHCLAAVRKGLIEDMPLPEVYNLIDQVAAMGVAEFLITGGEPLIREDLASVIHRLRERNITWSINTAIAPTPEQRKAMRAHPPALAAVSLDGPRDIHDAFRGRAGSYDVAHEAIAFFRSLPNCSVTAGTTVTTRNVHHLRETLDIVRRSGADHWGLHLLLPEGRAARRKDLFLGRRDLDRLLDFAARARSIFPTSICDEIGYLGELEPLVRDVPWACGAGVAQCVVLPDGSVVPCSTLDRNTSAGNLKDSSLSQIWAQGFSELRDHKKHGACASCEYERACGGGCWLQRRAGTHCYKEAWVFPDAIRSAAGIALCFGISAASAEPSIEQKSASDRMAAPAVAASRMEPQARPGSGGAYGVTPDLESVIINLVANDLSNAVQVAGETQFDGGLDPKIQADPAMQLVRAFESHTLPWDLTERCIVVQKALTTTQKSLGFAALAFRSLAESILDSGAAAVRPPAETAVLNETLLTLTLKAQSWRKEIFAARLDPYLARHRLPIKNRFLGSKAMRIPPVSERLSEVADIKRWGKNDQADWALDTLLERHPWAEGLILKVSGSDNVSIETPAGLQAVKHILADSPVAFGIADRLLTGATEPVVMLGWKEDADPPLPIHLPRNAVLTWPDVVALYETQHRAELDAVVSTNLKLLPKYAVIDIDPRLWPTMHRLVRNGDSDAQTLGVARWWLANMWLF